MYNEESDTMSRSGIMILSVCIGMFLGVLTIILVPAEYRPQSDETQAQDITWSSLFEFAVSIQGLVGMAPVIYFFLTLSVLYIIHRL